MFGAFSLFVPYFPIHTALSENIKRTIILLNNQKWLSFSIPTEINFAALKKKWYWSLKGISATLCRSSILLRPFSVSLPPDALSFFVICLLLQGICLLLCRSSILLRYACVSLCTSCLLLCAGCVLLRGSWLLLQSICVSLCASWLLLQGNCVLLEGTCVLLWFEGRLYQVRVFMYMAGKWVMRKRIVS